MLLSLVAVLNTTTFIFGFLVDDSLVISSCLVLLRLVSLLLTHFQCFVHEILNLGFEREIEGYAALKFSGDSILNISFYWLFNSFHI